MASAKPPQVKVTNRRDVMRLIRNLVRRKVRATLTIVGISVGIWALVVMSSMANKIGALVEGGSTYFGLETEHGMNQNWICRRRPASLAPVLAAASILLLAGRPLRRALQRPRQEQRWRRPPPRRQEPQSRLSRFLCARPTLARTWRDPKEGRSTSSLATSLTKATAPATVWGNGLRS